MRSNPRARRFAAASILCLAVAATGCSDDGDDTATSATTAPSSGSTAAPSTGGGDADAALEELIAAAQAEGSVTIYSSQPLDPLNTLAAAFEEEYDIDVEPVRLVDSDIIPRVETELATGTSGADLIVSAAQAFMETHAAAGDWVDPTASPQLAGDADYDAAAYSHEGGFFEVGAAILTFAWNTDAVPDGMTDYPDLLDPELAGGRIGVPDAALSPALVDFYLWLEEEYGEDFVTDLAAQEPRIYPSALPLGEALQSGEISAGAFATPVQLIPAAADGAPVDFGISEDAGAWGARFFGAIPASSDSPNAAALFADFMVRSQGQEIINADAGAVLAEVPGTLITNDRVREMDLEATAPEPAAAYVEQWNAMFR